MKWGHSTHAGRWSGATGGSVSRGWCDRVRAQADAISASTRASCWRLSPVCLGLQEGDTPGPGALLQHGFLAAGRVNRISRDRGSWQEVPPARATCFEQGGLLRRRFQGAEPASPWLRRRDPPPRRLRAGDFQQQFSHAVETARAKLPGHEDEAGVTRRSLTADGKGPPMQLQGLAQTTLRIPASPSLSQAYANPRGPGCSAHPTPRALQPIRHLLPGPSALPSRARRNGPSRTDLGETALEHLGRTGPAEGGLYRGLRQVELRSDAR